jgi:RimJ/RimL family protein N-acetyltransferase
MTAPALETPRRRLRPPVLDDYEPWAAFMADAGASHFIGGPVPRSIAWRGFMGMAGSWSLLGHADAAAQRKLGLWREALA